MGALLLLVAATVGFTVWRIRQSLTHEEARQLEQHQAELPPNVEQPAVETEPSGRPLSPLLLAHERELWTP